MTIEYLECRADLNFEVNFRVNGAIGTIEAKWDLSLYRKWIGFVILNIYIYIYIYIYFQIRPIFLQVRWII